MAGVLAVPRRVSWALVLGLISGCGQDAGSDAGQGAPDGARDASFDAGAADAGKDAGRDAGQDAARFDAGPQPPVTTFTDVTESAGLAVAHRVPEECVLDLGSRSCEARHMTGGAAVGDVDGDGWPDLYLTMLEGPDLLYRNLGDGTFADISAESGLAEHAFHSNGAAFVDIENDGDLDLYVTSIGRGDDPVNGRYYLFVNDGAAHFTEEATARGLALLDGKLHAGESVAVGDYDRDGYPDLHVTEWLPRSGRRPHTRLFHNRGAADPGHFDDVTRESGALTFSERCWDELTECSQYTFASSFSDIDGDGWPDLAVVSDFGRSRLFWNRGDGTFELAFVTADLGGDENGMGSTIADVDNDGDLDWFVSAIYDPDYTCALAPCTWGSSGNRLYRNEGGRTIVDGTDAANVRDARWGWGSAFFDAENDGDLDLVVTNGIAFPSAEYDDAYNDDRTRFWVNDGYGRMEERGVTANLDDTSNGKGLLVFDYDRDSDLDVFIANNQQSPHLYRNDGPTGSFLRVRLRGTESNAEALGARVWVRVREGGRRQLREIGSTSHFLGQSERVAHFGLGAGVTRVAEVEVRWPSGQTTRLTDVQSNRLLEIIEPRRSP